MKQKNYIDLHKGATFIYILILMFFFNDYMSLQSNNNISIYDLTTTGLGCDILAIDNHYHWE